MFTNKGLPVISFLSGAQWQVSTPWLYRNLAALCRKHLILCDLLIDLSSYKDRLMHRPHWAQLIMFCSAKKRANTLHICKEQCYLVRIRVPSLQPLLVLIVSAKNFALMPFQAINPCPVIVVMYDLCSLMNLKIVVARSMESIFINPYNIYRCI